MLQSDTNSTNYTIYIATDTLTVHNYIFTFHTSNKLTWNNWNFLINKTYKNTISAILHKDYAYFFQIKNFFLILTIYHTFILYGHHFSIYFQPWQSWILELHCQIDSLELYIWRLAVTDVYWPPVAFFCNQWDACLDEVTKDMVHLTSPLKHDHVTRSIQYHHLWPGDCLKQWNRCCQKQNLVGSNGPEINYLKIMSHHCL